MWLWLRYEILVISFLTAGKENVTYFGFEYF